VLKFALAFMLSVGINGGEAGL